MNNNLLIPLGNNAQGKQSFLDVAQSGNVLVMGTTGAGKSVFLHNLIRHLTANYSEQEVNLALIDNKYVELFHYQNLPHVKPFLAMTMQESLTSLKWLAEQIAIRKQKLAQNGLCDIAQYNSCNADDKLVQILLIVDEAIHLLFDDECYKVIQNILKEGPSVGVCAILSLQAFFDEVLTPQFRANFQHFICFKVPGEADSMAFLDQTGAEKLYQGEFLYKSPQSVGVQKIKVPFAE